MAVAKLQRWFLLLLLLISGITGLVLVQLGMPCWGFFAASAFLGSHAVLLFVEFVCLWCVEPPSTRPRAADLLAAWKGEVIESAMTFYWRQPFRSRRFADSLPTTAAGKRGLLLVHGLVCNRGFWNPWMSRLRYLDHPYVALSLEPVFGSIDEYSDQIADAVLRLRSITGSAPVILAHSQGGLAVRHWLRTPGAENAVHRVFTVGTPHHGTWMARFARTGSAKQMIQGSQWLQALAADEAVRGSRMFTCFYGNCDNVVFPTAGACLRDAENRLIARTAHVALAHSSEVFDVVLGWLDADTVQSVQKA